MKKNRRPREGVWYAHARDYLFIVQHLDINLWKTRGYYLIADEATVVWAIKDIERPLRAGSRFYEVVVFIGEF